MNFDKKIIKGNILLVANYKSDVGYAWWLMENFWATIAINFKNKKQCFLIYPEINAIPEVIKKAPIKIIKHDFSNRSLRSLFELRRIIKNNNIGFLYLTDRPYFDWIYLILRMWGVKKIINHDHMPGERNQIALYKKVFKKVLHLTRLFACDYYIGVSKFVKRRFVEIACVPEKRCTFVHNGIKVFSNTRTNYAHKVFNIPEGAKIVVTSGRATFYKGVDQFVKLAYVMVRKLGFENLYFLHLGSGPDLARFKEMSEELGVSHRLIFAGYRDDVTKILPSCDIGIQISLGEAFSLSILEYLCAGLATLAPNNCGNSEAIENGVNGFLFEPGNLDEIVEKITYLLGDEKVADSLRREARRSVEEKFTIEICNKKFISVMEELLR